VLEGRLGDEEHSNALLLVSEAVTNSVVHGGAHESETVALAVSLSRNEVHVEVSDPVGGFEPPPYPADTLSTSGRGLPMIHRLAATWGVGAAPGGALWFELPRAAA
jgi:anti-sigma regulatory factor (Ser/Thr protein kinase)